MHRDIKPSNILLNSRGNIKLCDFGVATETVNSIADTFVGTSTYMAPERIQGGAYTVRSDVWSVGLTVMELAVGRFPFDSSDTMPGDRASVGPMGILDLLQQIVHEPAPKLPRSDAFPEILHEFVAKCLLKKPEERPTPRELYDKDAFLQAAKRTPVDLQGWAVSIRRSRKAPPAPKPLRLDPSRGGSRNQTSKPRPTPILAVPAPSTRAPEPAFPYQPSHHTPTSGDIILNLAEPSDSSSARSGSTSQLSLEHLSLDSHDHYHQQQHQPPQDYRDYQSNNRRPANVDTGSARIPRLDALAPTSMLGTSAAPERPSLPRRTSSRTAVPYGTGERPSPLVNPSLRPSQQAQPQSHVVLPSDGFTTSPLSQSSTSQMRNELR